jgi:cytochrome c peroxidase
MAARFWAARKICPPNPSLSAKLQNRASIARGQDIYNTFPINFTNIGGFNNGSVLITPSVPTTCSACHLAQAGTSLLPQTQFAIGTGGQSAKFGGPAPSKDLPIFKLTCHAPYATPYDGPIVYTNDPGRALITGRCMDIGGKTIPQIRAMASRAPYFSDGSAATLRDVVEFYNKRFAINFTEQQKEDLTHFLEAM